MRNEYFLNVMRMLQSQLKEEEENYEKALRNDKLFFELKEIKQRIKSIRDLLLYMESNKETSLNQKKEDRALEVW